MENLVKYCTRGHNFLIKNTFASDVENGPGAGNSYEKRVKAVNERMGRIISNQHYGMKVGTPK